MTTGVRMCEAPLKSSPSKIINTQLLTGWMPFCCPANSVRALKGTI